MRAGFGVRYIVFSFGFVVLLAPRRFPTLFPRIRPLLHSEKDPRAGTVIFLRARKLRQATATAACIACIDAHNTYQEVKEIELIVPGGVKKGPNNTHTKG